MSIKQSLINALPLILVSVFGLYFYVNADCVLNGTAACITSGTAGGQECTCSCCNDDGPNEGYCGRGKGASEDACKIDAASKSGSSTTRYKSINAIMGSIYTYALYFLTIAVVFYIVYCGFKMVTAGDDSEQFSKAKTGIMMAIIGLIVAYLARPIIGIIMAAIQ